MKRIVLSSFRFRVRHRAHPGSMEASNEGARNRHTYAFRVRPVKALRGLEDTFSTGAVGVTYQRASA
ncbi:MAG TPA: hypothetical protein VF864_12650 [Gemmatimonadales bacterium]